MKKVKVKIKARTVILEPMFKIGERVMLEENLLIVEIYDVLVEKNKYKYKVFYPHLINGKESLFVCYENELEKKPIDYDQIIFNAYVEFRHKYYELLKRLRTPSIRHDY